MSGPGQSRAAVIVEFGEAAAEQGGLVMVELDDQLNRDDAGGQKSGFYPGDDVYVLLHHSSDLRVANVAVSSGSVTYVGRVTRSREQSYTFDHRGDVKQLGFVPSGRPAGVWFGPDGQVSLDGWELVAGRVPSIGTVSLPFSARLYRVSHPAGLVLGEDQEYLVRLVFGMEAV